MLRTTALVLLLWMGGLSSAPAQQEPAKAPRQPEAKQPPANGQPAPAAGGQEKLSDAERITRLQRTIEESERRLQELDDKLCKLSDPEGEYAKAEAEFKALDEELEAKRKELQKARDEGKREQATTLESEVAALEQRWKLAKDRFDLAIQERKTLEEQRLTLEQKIKQDKEARDKLLSVPATQPAAAPGQPPPTTTPAQPSTPPGAQPEGATPSAQPPAVVPGTPPAAGAPGAPATEGVQPPPGAPATAAEPAKPPSKELQKAQEEAQAKAEKAIEAEKEAQSIKDRIDQLRKQIELEKKQLETLRAKADNADDTRRTLNEQVQKRSGEGAPQAELQELWTKIAEARQRFREAQVEVNKKVDLIDQLQDELQRLQSEHIEALQEAEAARQEAEQAQRELERLRNPFSPRNMLQWVLSHGPRIVGILIAMIILLWLSRLAEHRIVKLLAGRAGPGTQVERENRAKTLMGVFHHAATWIIVIAGIFMILDEVGVPIAPLMGGAAVVGLAVAFGAQNLVRDYFSGFMILLENQYGINDVIKVGDIGGLVERVTLRLTVLRGLDGTVHFIPNGQIDKVSNMTHGWSRALFDIGVAYKEDVDQVMKVLVQLGKELRADPTFRQLILDDPEMLGVDNFGDSAVVIRFFIKTRPLQQWTVKRAMLRRIKKKFDELGIEIPFPHLTVYTRHEPENPPAPGLDRQGGMD